MKSKILPVGLKGNEINERMKELMGIAPINENKKTSAVELTKIGPDGNVYAIVRENHEYYIKTTTKKTNLVTEDFSYIGGLMNKKSEAYPSYAKAIKQLNLKFNSLNEAYGKSGQINVFEDDNLLKEMGYGFKSEGNLEGHSTSDCCGGQIMEGMCLECGGPAYGIMAEKKYSDDASEFISKEISHLVNDKGYSHERAVAAALAIAREKGYEVPEKSDENVMDETSGPWKDFDSAAHLANFDRQSYGDTDYSDYHPASLEGGDDEELGPELKAVDDMMKKDSPWKDFDSAAHLANFDRQSYGDFNESDDVELSPKQKAIARLAGDPDEFDADDLAALRAKKKGKLSIDTAISEMDSIIEGVLDSIKKKV